MSHGSKKILAEGINMRIKSKMLVNNDAKGCDLIRDGYWTESNVDTRKL